MSYLTKNKKGVGDVLASVLLIVLTLAAISLLGVYTKQILAETQLSPQISCIEMQSSNTIEIRKACHNSETGDLEITIRRSIQDFSLDEIQFTAEDTSWSCSHSCGNCIPPEIGQTKTYYLASETKQNIIVQANGCELDTAQIRDC